MVPSLVDKDFIISKRLNPTDPSLNHKLLWETDTKLNNELQEDNPSGICDNTPTLSNTSLFLQR